MPICDGCGGENLPTDQFCTNPRCRRYLGWQAQVTANGGNRSDTTFTTVRRLDPVEATTPTPGEPVVVTHEPSDVSYRLMRQRPIPTTIAPPPEVPPDEHQNPHLVSDADQALLLTLDVDRIDVQPGRDATITAEVHNKGSIVDSVDLAVHGVPKEWITVHPPTVNLYVDAKASFQIRVAPPLHSTSRPGPVAASVAVWSATNPRVRCIQRLEITVAAFGDLDASIDPTSVAGRRRGTYTLSLTNRGNNMAHASVAGADQEGAVAVRCQPSTVSIGPGGRGVVAIAATPPPLLRGKAIRHQVEITIHTGQHARQLPVVFQQLPILSKWMVRVLIMALGLVLAGALLLWHHVHVNRPISVPNVVGQTQQAAEQQLTSAHLRPQVMPASNGFAPAGTVSNENPPGGTHQKRGSTIVITVSSGATPVPSPRGAAPGGPG
jgi:hypothetical protein